MAKRKVVADPQPFVVKRSAIQGRGCFATRDVRKGERIAEYVGERISWKEADRRYDDDGMGRHHTFLFAVTTRTVIDGAVHGNDARFINHACDPNCEAVDERGRIYIEAVRSIAAGEELFYDYAYARDESTSEEDEALYVCKCGSPKCRGSILEPPKKRRTLPKTHHVAARHPHEHVGVKPPATKGRRTSSKTGSTKTAGKEATGKQAAGKQPPVRGRGGNSKRAGAGPNAGKGATRRAGGARRRPPAR